MISISEMKRRQPGCLGQSPSAGFTLIELLAVIVVMGIIMAISVPLLFSSMSANRLSGAGESLVSQIALARQYAVSRNAEVELRFYRYARADEPNSTLAYRAALLVKPSVAGAAVTAAEPLGPIFYFGSDTVLGETNDLSPILQDPQRNEGTDTEDLIASAGSTATYKSIRFYPDGSSDLTKVHNKSYLTVVSEQAMLAGGVPKNFFAIQIDPYTGRCSSYRP
jgi:uncharacterized protein (TIGR02596 family)